MASNSAAQWLVGHFVGPLTACLVTIAGSSIAEAQAIHQYSEAEIEKAVVEFETHYDRFSNAQSRTLKKALTLKRDGGFGYPLIIADLKSMSDSTNTLRALQVIYYGKDWVFLSGEATLLLDDGTRLTLGGEGELFSKPEREVQNRSIREVATFTLSCEHLSRLAAARGIDMRLHGSKANVDVWFPREGISALRTMRIETGCPTSPSAPPSQARTSADSVRVD